MTEIITKGKVKSLITEGTGEWYGNLWKKRDPELYEEYHRIAFEKDDACEDILP